MTRAVMLIALLCGCTSRPLVVPGPGDGSRDFSVVDHDLGTTDLAGTDLAGVDLAGADLAGTSGSGADMQPPPLPKTQGASVGTGIAVLAADLDMDGDADLVVVEAAGTVRIYNGNGKGALFPRQSFEINTNTKLATAILADVDADGVADLVLAEDGTKSEVDVLRGNGDATFADWARIQIPGGVMSVAVGDLDGDGAPDVVATTEDGLLHVMQGMKGGKPLLLMPTYPVDVGTTQTMLSDLTNDAHLYAITVAPGAGELTFQRGESDYTFDEASFASEPGESARFVVGDYDGDGLLDTATAGADGTNVVVQIDRSSDLGAPGVLVMPDLSSASGLDGLATGDMDGDGLLDLVISSDSSMSMVIALSTGTGQFPTLQTIAIDEGATSLALADFDGDGHLDVAAQGATKTQLYLTQP